LLLLPLLLALTACAGNPKRPPHAGTPVTRPAPNAPDSARDDAPAVAGFDPCAPTRVHRDSDYTPGGLYAPGVPDAGPATAIDVSALVEPVPRREPRARTGNRSPYSVLGKSYQVRATADGYVERGVASWYGTKFNGRATSSGELYDICQFTAAHKTLPLPSTVRVTNLDNGRSVVVRVNDRGPFHSGRIIDLSYAAAVRLGVDRTGTARVELRALTPEGEQEFLVADNVIPAAGSGGAGGAAQAAPADVSPVAGRRWVQVGSFADKDNAQRLAARLRAADIDDVDIDKVEVADRDLWRVRIGPVAGDRLAALLGRLPGLGVANARVVAP
jgi:rare lipoprotein A